MTQASKRPRKETKYSVIIVNTPEKTATMSKEKATSGNTHQKEKVDLKCNFFNNEKVINMHSYHAAKKN